MNARGQAIFVFGPMCEVDVYPSATIAARALEPWQISEGIKAFAADGMRFDVIRDGTGVQLIETDHDVQEFVQLVKECLAAHRRPFKGEDVDTLVAEAIAFYGFAK